MDRIRSSAVCFVSAVAAPIAAGQSTWHVAAGAAPGGDGSIGAPYATIQSAVDAPSTLDGDTLSVAAGEYIENVRLNGKRVTLLAVDGPTVTTLRGASPGTVALLDATGCFFEGFTVTGAFQGPAIRVPSAQQGNAWIRRCIVTGNEGVGIAQNYDAQIENCTILGNGDAGIVTGPLAVLSMSSTIVWGNGAPTGTFLGFGTSVQWCVLDNDVCGACGNLEVDPQLWNPLLGDFRLRLGSPCVDAGDPSGPLDPDSSRNDIGALPLDATYVPPPQRYCTSKPNSLGCIPRVAWSGIPSMSSSMFTIECTQVLKQRSGLFFYGFAPKFAPFQGGHLCVSPPSARTPITQSGGNPTPPDDCSGIHTFDFGAYLQSGADPSLGAGTMVYGQFWFRDPASSFHSGRSDAISFGVRP